MSLVLLVEDEIAHLILLREILQAEPALTLIEADTGAQGLRLARLMRPDLVILDARLPDMDGVEVGRLIKTDPTLPHTRLLFVTVVADLVAEWLPETDAYLRKPYEGPELPTAVHRLLGTGGPSPRSGSFG